MGPRIRWLTLAYLIVFTSHTTLSNVLDHEYDWELEYSFDDDLYDDFEVDDALDTFSKATSARPQDLLLRIIFPEHEAFRDLLCSECVAAAAALDSLMAAGASEEQLEDLAIETCIRLDLYPEPVCNSMVNLVSGEVLHILNYTEYNYTTFCWFFVGGHCQEELKEWTLPILGGKPEPDNPEPILPAANTIRIMHITDTHLDLQYEEGSIVLCDYPLCCRSRYGEPLPGDPVAGHWGATNCDLPLNTLDDLVYQASLLQPDLVYITGDLPAHNVWEQTPESNIEAINATLRVFQKYFPDTPVLNCLGNHAPAPVNSFVVPAAYDDGYNMDWLYEASVDMWSHWLPQDTFTDIQRGGFFSYSPLPGFRVISVNMNYCHNQNWWLLIDNEDPTGELQWLMDTLAAAEVAGEKVHLLTHFYPSPGKEKHWVQVFNNIVTRFESTIRGLFYGHSHIELFSLIYDPEDTLRPVAVGFVAPGGAANENHQPAFKMYTVDGGYDGATWSVIDMQTYTMNITLANSPGGQPEYLQRYTSQEAYNVSTLTAASVDQLTLNMAADKDLFAQYVRNIHNYQLDPPEMYACAEDPGCHKGQLCRIVNTDPRNSDACSRLEAIVDTGNKD